MALLEEVCHWEVGTEVLKAHTSPASHSTSLLANQDVALSYSSSAIQAAMIPAMIDMD